MTMLTRSMIKLFKENNSKNKISVKKETKNAPKIKINKDNSTNINFLSKN